MIGALGLNFDTILVVCPEDVQVMIALASKSRAVVQVACDIASVTVTPFTQFEYPLIFE